MKRLIPFAIVSMLLGACAGTVAPAARMASAQAAIRSAHEVGAEQNPTAALYLQYAREEYSQANQLSQRGDGDQATRVLQRSEADAELSMALARRAAARVGADQAAGQMQNLQSHSPMPAQQQQQQQAPVLNPPAPVQ